MKNIEIIAMNVALLIKNGVIKPENEINTYIGWKKRGFQVKKGEEHIAEFSIWVRNKKKEEPEETEEETAWKTKKQHRDFNLVVAYWFTDEQVEKI